MSGNHSLRSLRAAFGVIAATALAAVGTAAAATAVRTDASANWAGYVVNGASFTSVSGNWVVPAVDCTSTEEGASAFWVGLGGNETASGALEQAGTSAECAADGTARYWAWYELVPAPAVRVPLRVNPGHVIAVSVSISGKKVTLQMRNTTRKMVVTRVKTMAAPDTSSAEWVTEAPSICEDNGACRTVRLADFGKVRFTGAKVTGDGHMGSISDPAWTATAIKLISDFGGPSYGGYPGNDAIAATATPTALAGKGSAFSVRWQGIASVPSFGPPAYQPF